MKKILLHILFNAFLSGSCFTQSKQQQLWNILKYKIETEQNDTLKADLLREIAFSYVFIYSDTAAFYANESIELSRRIHYINGEATGLSALGLALTVQGNFTAAMHYNYVFLNLAKAQHDTALIMDAYNNIMICYRDQEDYKEALKYGFMALAFSNSPKVDSTLNALTLGFISSVYEKNNQPDSALYYGLKAIKFIRTWDWSGLHLTLGNTYSKLGKNELSMRHYRKSIEVAEKSFVFIDLVDVYNKLAILYEENNNADSSLYFARKSIATEGIQNYPEGELRAVSQLARFYELHKQQDSAIKYLKRTDELRARLFNRQKTREAQSLAFNERLSQQELEAERVASENKRRTYLLLSTMLISMLIILFFWRNNIQKQKAKNKIEQAYNELKTTQQQLIQSAKMASLGELTAGIAHEIQNPLNFVNNFSELSTELITEMNVEIDKGNTDEVKAIASDIKQNLEKINHHGKRADSIVKGMLQHSQKGSGQKEPTDINAMAEEYLRLAYHACLSGRQGCLAKDITLNASFVTDLDKRIGNVNLVQQDISRVLLNLYNNAFYALSAKSSAEAIVKDEALANADGDYQPLVTLTTKRKEDFIEISIKDNGNGIPENIMEKIFQPFFTTKPTGQGTGLGLSLSYDIVKAHGGEIKVQAKEGEGTEFLITIPIKSN